MVAALAAPAALAGCSGGPRFGAPEPVTEEGGHVLRLWQGFFIAACLVGLLMLGLIFYAAIRFRRRSDRIPSQNGYNIPVEVLYTVTPVLVVAVLFGFSVATWSKVNHQVARPDLVVQVTGFQWGWQFAYPDRGVTITGTSESTRPMLVLPVDRITRLVLRTTDVIHSFWVPAFLEKRDLIAGVDNAIDVTPRELGTFGGRCAEYCALDHWRMTFLVQIVAADQLDAALAEAQRQGDQGGALSGARKSP
jgi:cytochrome c oxidase subunit 2